MPACPSQSLRLTPPPAAPSISAAEAAGKLAGHGWWLFDGFEGRLEIDMERALRGRCEARVGAAVNGRRAVEAAVDGLRCGGLCALAAEAARVGQREEGYGQLWACRGERQPLPAARHIVSDTSELSALLRQTTACTEH